MQKIIALSTQILHSTKITFDSRNTLLTLKATFTTIVALAVRGDQD